MTQGPLGGAGNYAELSLEDILQNVCGWMEFAEKTKLLLNQNKNILRNNGFWQRVGYDFKEELGCSLLFIDTILHDLSIVKNSLSTETMTPREVALLWNIGKKSAEFTNNYKRSYSNDTEWMESRDRNCGIVEDIYAYGRDFFVTLQDAGNAAYRLRDYIGGEATVMNKITIQGNVIGSQIQQSSPQSYQVLNHQAAFAYDVVLECLQKICKALGTAEAQKELGDAVEEVEKTLRMPWRWHKKRLNWKKLKNTCK